MHSLGNYDETVAKWNGNTNCLHEAFSLWKKFTNRDLAKHVPVVVLLNKLDLLKEKFFNRRLPIARSCLPEDDLPSAPVSLKLTKKLSFFFIAKL